LFLFIYFIKVIYFQAPRSIVNEESAVAKSDESRSIIN